MKASWPESIRFHHPLRSVTLAVHAPASPSAERIAELERASYERGRADGERSLGNQLLQQRNELLELQSGVLQSLRNSLPAVAQECERALVDLALETARKLVDEMPLTAEMIEATVQSAVSHLQDTTEYTILVHADDLTLLQTVNSPTLLQAASGQAIRILPSAEVSRGGCIIRTRFGTVDARREAKLDLLRKSLLA